MASLAAITTGGGGLVSTADSTGNLDLKSGTTTIVALTSTGASVTGDLSATGITTVAAGTAALPAIVSTTGTNDTGLWFPAADTVAASTGGAERLRIDSSGGLMVNTTSMTTTEQMGLWYSSNNGPGLTIRDTAAQNGNTFIRFSNGATTAGNITTNGTTTTSYGTSSDYRMKENIQLMSNTLEKVLQLKPCTYNWKQEFGGSSGQGFIAHELQAIVPDCVTGEKDAVDADGKPIHQGIDTSFLVATLTAAIQELKAIINTQAAQIAALNAKVGI